MWDLSSPTRDRTLILCIAKWILNHWTIREVSSHFNFEQTGKVKARRLVSGRDSSRVEISCNLTVCSPHFMSQGAHLCSSWRHIFISESRKLWLASSVVRGRMRVCPRRLPSLTSVQGIVWGTLQVEALLLFLFFYCEPRQVTQSLWASVSFLVRNMEHVFLLHLTRQN